MDALNDSSFKRYNLFLPINRNTQYLLNRLLILIRKTFGGCTFSRYHIPPVSLGCRELHGYFIGKFGKYPDEDICLITFDVDLKKNPNVFERLKSIVDMIKQSGEDVVWLTYQDIMLYQPTAK